LLALTVWRCARQDCDFTGRLDSDCRTFPAACRRSRGWTDSADFNISRKTDPDDPALLAGLFLVRSHLVVICNTQGLFERALVIAAVIKQTSRSLERKLSGLREILSSHFNGIQSELGGDQISATLNNLCSLRSACSPISIGGHFVCEHRGNVHLDRRDLVTTREHQPGQCWNCWR